MTWSTAKELLKEFVKECWINLVDKEATYRDKRITDPSRLHCMLIETVYAVIFSVIISFDKQTYCLNDSGPLALLCSEERWCVFACSRVSRCFEVFDR